MPKTKQTKSAKIQAMLRRPSGASFEAICKATGWQQHSARAAISTLRKSGATIERRLPEKPGAAANYHMAAEASS
ncbi:MAG: DUF3489 domain-containing protein [Pseudomonadota bacterium]